MQQIPLNPVPSQYESVQLGGQSCQINVYEKAFGVFVDLYVNNLPIVRGVIGLNRTLIVRSAYLGFIGDLMFVDTQGSTDPRSVELGSRYLLVYLSPSETGLVP